MPKLKTNKAAAKRYSYTATEKVKRTKAKFFSSAYSNAFSALFVNLYIIYIYSLPS